MERTSWVVKTPEGFLGKKRHNFRGSQPERKTTFKFARVFTREADAHKSCEPGDAVLPVTITVNI
jgi:hypothetical protein